jgi:hypothetical protein
MQILLLKINNKEKMKRDKIFYWIATSLVALSGVMAGIMYFVSPFIAKEFKHLGFPDYFRIELATAKILGAFAIILPMVPGRVKEWTYAGFAIAFISATTAHISVESVSNTMKSAFDDENGYELTELGQQFVHYKMNELVPRIS